MTNAPGTVVLALADAATCRELATVLEAAGLIVLTRPGGRTLAGLPAGAPLVLVVEANAVARARRRTTGREAVVVGVLRGSDAASRASVLLSGADDVLTLPMDPAELVARLQAHLRTVRLWQQLRGELASLRALAAVDPLTELGNRRAFEQELERQLANQQRTGAPLAVLLLDVDQFKRLNDTAGHPAGDAALVALAQVVAQRDRFGAIVARFFFANLAHLRLCLGDPHPGNYLRLADGRVAFLDFGLVRTIPKDHLEREKSLAGAAIAGDAEAVKRAMAELGYLPEPASFDAELLLAQVCAAAGWMFERARRRLDPRFVMTVLEEGGSPRSPFFAQMRRQTVPPASLLMRRMEGLLLSVLGDLRAAADWGGIVAEYVLDGDPVDEFGRADAEFWSRHGGRSRGAARAGSSHRWPGRGRRRNSKTVIVTGFAHGRVRIRTPAERGRTGRRTECATGRSIAVVGRGTVPGG
ncbi:MAG: diguanylate cyclase [Chloroflexi bacterium]|nr:diguanylate cyclase [Chloroflexota bacterium]